MTRELRGLAGSSWSWILLFLAALAPLSSGQTCQLSTELDEPTRTAITTTGQRLFGMAAKGDTASMSQNAIPSLASDFAGIDGAVKDRQADLAGAQPTVQSFFLLDASGLAPIPHAEFYCGVFGKNGQTSNSTAFVFDNLPAAKYAVVLIDATSPKGKTMFSEILQQMGNDWKLAGLYIKSGQIAGHDADWFLAQARQFKAKGQTRNAWLFFVQATDIISRGLPFMSTLRTDQLYDETHSVQPPDLPADGKPVDLAVNGTTYKLYAIYPWLMGTDLDLFVKYQVPDASNTAQAYGQNLALIKALVTKFPELRDPFPGVDAIALDSNGRNYGTLLAMKDIK